MGKSIRSKVKIKMRNVRRREIHAPIEHERCVLRRFPETTCAMKLTALRAWQLATNRRATRHDPAGGGPAGTAEALFVYGAQGAPWNVCRYRTARSLLADPVGRGCG